MRFKESLFLKLTLHFVKQFKKTLKKDEYFVFWACLLFYLSLYFNLNNKTLLGLFFLFLFIFYKKLRDSTIALLILYLLFLPFQKGKAFDFVLIPAWLINKEIPYTFGFAVTFADLAFLALFGLIIRDEIVNRWRIRKLKLKKEDLFLFAFVFFVFASVFFSQFQLVSSLAFLKLVRVVATYFLIQWPLFKPRLKELIFSALASLLLFQGGWASLQFFLKRPLGKAIEHVSGPFSVYGHVAAEERTFFRAQGTFDHPNTLGSFLVMLLAFFLVQSFNPNQDKEKKTIFLASFLFGLLGLVFSASRVSWVMALLMSGLILIFLKRQKRLVVEPLMKRWLVGIALPLVFFFPFLILPRLGHLYISLLEHGGVYYRTYLLEKAWLLARQSPLGIGLATFPAVLVRRFGFFSWPAPVHNLWLEILVETGIFSLVFFLLFLIFAYKRFITGLGKLKGDGEFFLKSGAFFASLGFLGVAQFYPFFWSSNIFVYFWLFLGLMLY